MPAGHNHAQPLLPPVKRLALLLVRTCTSNPMRAISVPTVLRRSCGETVLILSRTTSRFMACVIAIASAWLSSIVWKGARKTRLALPGGGSKRQKLQLP